MKRHLAQTLLLAGAAIVSLPALAQSAPGPRDPYSQGAATNTGTGMTDPNAGGARSPDKFDPYTQGADQPTRRDLAPGQTEQAAGSQGYTDRSRWVGPNLGTRLGTRNPFLDGA
jgi:hypothetical protein